jgi:hypothetical protein
MGRLRQPRKRKKPPDQAAAGAFLELQLSVVVFHVLGFFRKRLKRTGYRVEGSKGQNSITFRGLPLGCLHCLKRRSMANHSPPSPPPR